MIYATQDSHDYGCIDNAANISKFKTLEQARAWLLESYNPSEWDHSTAIIEAGTYGDAWYKSLHKPKVGSKIYQPFSYTQLRIYGPGAHPGGKFYWITPLPDVLTVSSIQGFDKEED